MKSLLYIVLGFVGGWFVGQAMISKPWLPTPETAETQAPVLRISTEVLDICDTIRPALLQLQQAYRDGRLTAGELYSIYEQVNRLT